MYQNYGAKEKRRVKNPGRLVLGLVFLGSFGFTGGVLFLLFVMVPIEQWLKGAGLAQGAIDAVMAVLTFGWGGVVLLATVLYWRILLSQTRNVPIAASVLGIVFAAGFATFYFLLDTDVMIALGKLNEHSVRGERITFGSYPDAQKLEDLKAQGYDGIITLLNPKIPFEKVLLEREIENAEKTGIPVYSFPMLPWISENDDSLSDIERLVTKDGKRYYIHCYLGKHRVDLVRQRLASDNIGIKVAKEEPLPNGFERGRLATFDDERIILGPYPTDDEWFDWILRQNVEEVVSTLDPSNPNDVSWIRREQRICEENGITFTLRPLDPNSPDPARVRETARYAAGLDHRVFVHDFNVSKRFERLEIALRRSTRDGAKTPGG